MSTTPHIKFKIVTPERVALDQEADSLTCETAGGQITILPGHIPLIAPLRHGELVARVNGQPQYIAVSGGFVEVRPGNEVIILADSAEHAYEINQQQAEQARKQAQESMKNASRLSEEEYANLAAVLEKNLARLKVAKKHAHRGHHGVASQGVLKE